MKNKLIALCTVFLISNSTVGNAGLVRVQKTSNTASKVVFTNNLLIEKVMQIDYTPDGRIFSFTQSGEVLQFEKFGSSWSVISRGNWKINDNGTLTISQPSETITIMIEKFISDDKIGKLYTASCFDSRTPNVVKGPLVVLIR